MGGCCLIRLCCDLGASETLVPFGHAIDQSGNNGGQLTELRTRKTPSSGLTPLMVGLPDLAALVDGEGRLNPFKWRAGFWYISDFANWAGQRLQEQRPIHNI